MEQLQTLALALGLSTLAGLRLYLTVFLTSLSLHQGWLTLHPAYNSLEILGSEAVLIASGVLLVLEFLADKVQGFDSIWDSIHTIVRPIGATMLALQVLGDWPGEAKVIAALCAGTVALTVHSAKAGARLLVNTSPEPVSNVALSSAEDLAVAGMFAILVANPILGGSIALATVVFCAWATPKAYRMAKASAWLLWQRLTRYAGAPVPVQLPRQLSSDHDLLVSGALGHDTTVDWAVAALSSRPRRIRGLSGNHFGLLVATQEQPGTLVFLMKKFFGRRPVRIPLDGAHAVRESSFLSENLVIYHRQARQRAVFRFAKAEAAIVDRLVEDIKTRANGPVPPALDDAALGAFPDRLRSAKVTAGAN